MKYVDNGGKKLIYTNFEPHNASIVFPCFDQPNLKSDFILNILADKDFVFISNSDKKTENMYEGNNKLKITKFERIENICTYQLCLFGSSFVKMKDDFRNNPDINIYLTNTYEKEINPINIYMLIRDAINWFSGKFDSIFPLNKIDIVFLPNFEKIADSYPGAVIIIDERYLDPINDKIDQNYFNLLIVNQM